MSVTSHGYDLIAAYGHHIGASAPYIQALCNQARTGRAPLTAVCERGGHWVTAEEITDEQLRAALGLTPIYAATTDPAALLYRPVESTIERQTIAVSLATAHEPVIGTLVRYLDGSGRTGATTWTAFPTGQHWALTGRFAEMNQAGAALAALVPDDAVYFRNGWVTEARITRPSTRLAHGLPILTPEQFATADDLLILDAAYLMLSTAEQAAAVSDREWLPVAGQAAVADRGTVYWLAENGDAAELLSKRCEACLSEAGNVCGPDCTRPVTSDPRVLVCAPVTEHGRVDWTSIGAVDLFLIDEEDQFSVERALTMLESCAAVPRTALPALLPHAVHVGDAEMRVWEDAAARNRHVIHVYGANITVEQWEDGTTLVRVDADRADTALCVEVDGREVG